MGGTVSTTSSNTTIMMIDHDENHNSSMILPNFPKYVVSGGNDVETEVLCPTGTYPINDSCVLCPKGTYNPFEGARDESFCMKCRAGSFNNQTGQHQCTPCPLGTFQSNEGQESCDPCPIGYYADKEGSNQCTQCPYGLSNIWNGSDVCDVCDEGYYFVISHDWASHFDALDLEEYPHGDSATAMKRKIVMYNPDLFCIPCPDEGVCTEKNTTIETMRVKPDHWRPSTMSSSISRCQNTKSCVGGTCRVYEDGGHSLLYIRYWNYSPRNYSDYSSWDSLDYWDYSQNSYYAYDMIKCTNLCEEGYVGPLCEVCDNKDYYSENGECRECPSIFFIIFVAAIITTVLSSIIWVFVQSKYDLLPRLHQLSNNLSLQAKGKILISFYQILSSFDSTYNIQLHPTYKVIMDKLVYFVTLDFLKIFSGAFKCTIPSTPNQFIWSAVFPYIVMVLGATVISCCFNSRGTDSWGRKSRLIQWIILVIYFVLPSQSQKYLYDMIRCQNVPMGIDAQYNEWYLKSDMSIRCNGFDSSYTRIKVVFWIQFFIWTILMPFCIWGLLMKVGPSIRSQKISKLANASRYLWNDYKRSHWYWEVVEIYRKIILCGLISYIGRNETVESAMVLRIIMAIGYSVVFLTVLMMKQPYKRMDDFYLAVICQILLILCFVLGVMLSLSHYCDIFHRFDDEYGTVSLLIVVMVVGSLAATILYITKIGVMGSRAETVSVVATGYNPNLELPEHCDHHVFASHVWSTGQARTHAIVRRMKPLLPGLKVWLDVDELFDLGQLESSVESSAVFMLYYSRGYFRSKNCRRELYTAIECDKPIIVVFEGDGDVLEEMKQECLGNCSRSVNDDEVPDAEQILEKILKGGGMNISGGIASDESIEEVIDGMVNGPIQWLSDSDFSPTVLNMIFHRILINLPYYQQHPLEIKRGIRVPGEIGKITLPLSVNVLVCEGNLDSNDLAHELMELVEGQNQRSTLNVLSAATFLESRHETGDSFMTNQEVDVYDLSSKEYKAMRLSHYTTTTFLLLYLNEHTFDPNGHPERTSELCRIIQRCCHDADIKIILVHEKDQARGGCSFKHYYQTAPQELINDPCNLFDDLAVPLYSMKEYREISLKLILRKMGGE